MSSNNEQAKLQSEQAFADLEGEVTRLTPVLLDYVEEAVSKPKAEI